MNNKMHKNSQIIGLPDFEVFEVPPIQNTIEQSYHSEHRPLSQLRSDGNLEFQVNSSLDEYILLRDTMLYLKLKIDIQNTDQTNSADVTVADWDCVQPVNNFMHSLFQTIDLEINGKSITKSPQTYAYKAFFENSFGYTRDAINTHMSSVGFCDITNKLSIDPGLSDFIQPNPVEKSGAGKEIDLLGKLNLDLAMQSKALIGGTKLRFTLKLNDPKFYIWNVPATAKAGVINKQIPTVTLLDACLYVAKCKVNPTVVEGHNLMLAKCPAKYPITRGEVKSFTIPKDLMSRNIDNVVTGQLPRRIFIAMVKNNAFMGDLLTNPYNFEHFNLNYIAASIDGKQYPITAFQPDFDKGLYTREYLSVFEALNQLSTDAVYNCKREDYVKGNVIFGLNFGQDTIDDVHKTGYLNPAQTGTLNIHLQFKKALVKPITVLVYCEFDNMVEIDINRNVITDYV